MAKTRAKATPRLSKKAIKPSARHSDWRKKFIVELARIGNVRLACELAGVERTAVYRARAKAEAARAAKVNAGPTPALPAWAAHDDFAAQWDRAIEEAIDRLEQEAWRRAVNGVDEPVFYQGSVSGLITRYSDTLMVQLLKAHRPEKYRERFENVGNPIIALTQVTGDEMAKARADASAWEKKQFGEQPSE